MKTLEKTLSNIVIGIIKTYKYLISPILGPNCRFLPTCSNYFIESIQKKGFLNSYIIHDFSYEIEENLNYIFYLDDGNELIIESKNDNYSTKRKKLKNEILVMIFSKFFWK